MTWREEVADALAALREMEAEVETQAIEWFTGPVSKYKLLDSNGRPTMLDIVTARAQLLSISGVEDWLDDDALSADDVRARVAALEPVFFVESSATTLRMVEAIAWERAPRRGGRSVNRRVVCADGFRVSVQASDRHYADDSGSTAPYWSDEPPVYPFTTFEIGHPTGALPESWEEYDSGGVWAWVPRQAVTELLDLHGGAVAWEHDEPEGGTAS